ncbi:MAG: glucosyl-3-phosphoglycerate synthase, partial [Chloroflexi bacterium]|nr:glucosyl-3-phosphoglycerate synthase [Chloroflexota bacterium]
MSDAPPRLLIPAFGPSFSEDLLAVGQDLLTCYGGGGTVLSVVEVPEERSLSEGALVVRRRRRLLQRIERLLGDHGFRAEVRTAHSVEHGIREAVRDLDIRLLLIGWKPRRRTSVAGAIERLVAAPPCDLAMVKQGGTTKIESVLVPARGGPHALLALTLAEAVAADNDAVLTLLHIQLPSTNKRQQAKEDNFFAEVRARVRYANVRHLQIAAESVEAALLEYGARSDLVIMGAARRDEKSSFLLGRIPETVARKLDSTVIVVKTQEPVTAGTFGLDVQPLGPPQDRRISDLVDRWFAENTFHSHEFRNLGYLVDLKERQNRTISLALPTLNEEKTVGKIVSTIKRQLVERYPLIDELIVIDSNSEDKTVDIVSALGVPVYKHPDILPEHGSYRGKGEALWKSMYATKGDILVWVDSDITGFHPKFVYGLLGPLLTQPRVGFVKGFYRRPLNLGGQLLTTGGGRVTELTARPLINLFYPHLSGLVQPLAGEMAGRRDVLEAIP